jgi:uncharacterized protein (TIGR00369 family)
MTVDPALAQMIEQVLGRSPYGNLLGWHIAELAPERAVIALPFKPELATVGRIIHGGAIASLADVAAAAAAWSNADPKSPPRGVTVALTLNYIAVADGSDLTAEAVVVRRGRSIVPVDVTIRDAAGTTVARAMATYKIG